LIAKACHAAEVSAKEEADNNCNNAGPLNPSCKCNGQYSTSECHVIYDADHSCYVTADYKYAGVCDGMTAAPTVAPSCPDKECRGENAAYVFKAEGDCKSSTLDKLCLKSMLSTKMNADLECRSDQCSCQGDYNKARCFSVPVKVVLKRYCYYFAKYKYEGYCSSKSYCPITARPTSSPSPYSIITARPTSSPSPYSTISASPTASASDTALNDVTIRKAAEAWVYDKNAATLTYGNISKWNTSLVTNMTSLFDYDIITNNLYFNEDISNWNTSRVTVMKWMFHGTFYFNQNLSSWDVSKVTDMSGMFHGSSSFNGDISSWNVSKVTDMSGMFRGASSFNGDISSWDVSKVSNMSNMFMGAVGFNGDISSWNVSSVTDMTFMFLSNDGFNGNISSWNVNAVTSMWGMFYFASSFNQTLCWNTSPDLNVYQMFDGSNGNFSTTPYPDCLSE
jgi:surface protein